MPGFIKLFIGVFETQWMFNVCFSKEEEKGWGGEEMAKEKREGERDKSCISSFSVPLVLPVVRGHVCP